jgi:hypothetical protein
MSPITRLIPLTLAAAFCMPAVAADTPATGLEPLNIQLPTALFVGTPKNIKSKNLEPPRTGLRPPLMVPSGVVNLSKKQKVTASDSEPVIGDLAMITDGDKDASSGSFVELGPNTQWAQINLEAPSEIWAVVIWHFHSEARVYRDVVVQIADDADFTTNVRTLFNNDDDNSSGLGVGKDMEYIDSNEGKLIEGKGAVGRFVRCYSCGNTSNDLNHYIEIEVWGKKK